MHSDHLSHGRTMQRSLCCTALGALLVAIGCASPGPPRAPSLSLPTPVRDLSATRIGKIVELHFTAPSRTTDQLPLRGAGVTGQFCRQIEHQSCQLVAASKTTVMIVGTNGTHDLVTWTDTLPSELTHGTPRLLAYRVEFFSPAGRSAGLSSPAFTATGPSPAHVDDLRAQGTRLGTLLSWSPSPQLGDVLLHRDDLSPTPQKLHKTPGVGTKSAPSEVWLQTHGPSDSATPPGRTLDTTALPDTPYRYTAQRRLILPLGGHSIDLRSSTSTPILFTLREIYPPPAPTGLTALGFFSSAPSQSNDPAQAFAVDLIWQPVDDIGLLAALAGYNIYRIPLNPAADPTAPRTRLNAAPTPTPAFHDTTADPATRYRYAVTAIDSKGNESPAASVVLEPSATH